MRIDLLFLGVACLVTSSATAATTISFDDLPALPPFTPGYIENDRYLSQGLLVENSGRADTRALYVSNPAITTSGANYIYAGDGLFPGATLILSFLIPDTNIKAVVDYVSLDVCDYPDQSSGLWTMQALGVDGTVLETVQDTVSFQRNVQFLRPQADIYQIAFISSADYDVVDTLSFSNLVAAPVPEPAEIGLLGIGLIAWTGTRKRRGHHRA